MRFRVNGQAFEFDELPALKKTEKHDLDVVIDRIKVRPDLKQRLAESFEAALRVGGGRAIAVETDRTQANNDGAQGPSEHLFNAKFSCPVCSYSIGELEPRLFSFNSPQGACPACDGLGMQEFLTRRGWWPFPR